ncbi:hypothetical protein [Roseiconus lacunae]|uniref:Uncharacterized protein n=2 Tax=Roseiconus lacunae TaxID=2605694 RepID=A0ABT7PSN5_9BACT|nr:hypothetical protein [Roseiconus lacunae]MDM4019500.1 hypothetical protein [Roseiconus lacunae]
MCANRGAGVKRHPIDESFRSVGTILRLHRDDAMGVQDHEPLLAIVGCWKRLPNRDFKSDHQETEVASSCGGPTTVTISGLCVVPNSKLEEPTSVTKHDERW